MSTFGIYVMFDADGNPVRDFAGIRILRTLAAARSAAPVGGSVVRWSGAGHKSGEWSKTDRGTLRRSS